MIGEISKLLIYAWQKSHNGVENYANTSFSIVKHGVKSDEDDSLFLNAHIKFEEKEIVGSVKIVETSYEWQMWNSVYKASVIMVVTPVTNDMFFSFDGASIKRFKPNINREFINRYNELIYSGKTICGGLLRDLSEFEKEHLFSQLIVERLNDKCENVFKTYKEASENWNDTALAMLFDSVMISNKKLRGQYRELVRRIGYSSIIKGIVCGEPQDDILNVEALLFGTAGLLNARQEHYDNYTYTLRQKFDIIKSRHKIVPLNSAVWQTSSVNRNNSVSMQLAQLSAIIVATPTLHYTLVESSDFSKLIDIFNVKISEYWASHSALGVESTVKNDVIFSKSKIDILIINFIIPYLFYFNSTSTVGYDNTRCENLLDKLLTIKDESNSLVNGWREYVDINSAFRSQAIIQLTKRYCLDRNCYKCRLGRKFLDRIAI